MANDNDLLQGVQQFFSDKVIAHGANFRGADYGTPERQLICFDQLTKILPNPAQSFSINDYGCGYGALVDYLTQRGYQFTYTGFDISEAMLEQARSLYSHRAN
jgi:SAM-dependent methyltransferase